MSISPQSLAKSRDKRSLRMPSRFNDFREIPTEVAYRDVAEALKLKGRDSLNLNDTLEIQKDEENPELSAKKAMLSLVSKKRKKEPSNEKSKSSVKRGRNENEDGQGPSMSGDRSSQASNTSGSNSPSTFLDDAANNSSSSSNSGGSSVSSNSSTSSSSASTISSIVSDTSSINTSNESSRPSKDSNIKDGDSENPSAKITTPVVSVTVESSESGTKPGKSSERTESIVTDKSKTDTAASPTPRKPSNSTAHSEIGSKSSQRPPAKASIPQTHIKSSKQATGSTPHQQAKPKIADYSRNRNKLDKLGDSTEETPPALVEELAIPDPPKEEKGKLEVAGAGECQPTEICTANDPTPSKMKKQKQQSATKIKKIGKQSISSTDPSNIQLPLVEKKGNPEFPPDSPRDNSLKVQSPTSRKKSKGLSLMAKPSKPIPADQSPQQTQPTPSNSNINRPPQAHQFVYQQGKPFSAITTQPNTHYGTRLLFNEPLYLPRSVAPIAPITTSLQQIVAQARRPPFLSKKYQACIDFQSKIRFNQICTTHQVMVRIAEQLGLRDRSNLRCVNRAWKSVIDSDQLWSRVIITNAENGMRFDQSLRRMAEKTKEIALDGFVSAGDSDQSSSFAHFCLEMTRLERITIRSLTPAQNNWAYRTLNKILNLMMTDDCVRAKNSHLTAIVWYPRVGIDSTGLASVWFKPEPSMDATQELNDDCSVKELWLLTEELCKKIEECGDNQVVTIIPI